MFNMFVRRKESFNAYVSFMFEILETVEREIDISDYYVQEKQVFYSKDNKKYIYKQKWDGVNLSRFKFNLSNKNQYDY